MSQVALALVLIIGTFASEDAAGLYAGSLVHQAVIHPLLAGGSIFLGIWFGDLLLFFSGRYLRPLALRWERARRLLADPKVAGATRWLEHHTWKAIAITRVLPGSRLPTYLAAGLMGLCPYRFMAWTALACLLWTPLLIAVGAGGTSLVHQWFPDLPFWLIASLAVGILIGCLSAVQQGISASARRSWVLRWQRWTHHEWWPTWMLYVPLIPIGIGLAIHHRSLRAPLLANPALPDSGIVGESKAAVLHRLTAAPVLAWVLLPAGTAADRLVRLERWLISAAISWPVILKPDAGERGSGVRLAHDPASALSWLENHPRRAIAQRYHPGPVEVSLFWARIPGQPGRILSITDKCFAEVIGDGRRTIAELIDRHSRFRIQSAVYLRRLGDGSSRIPGLGERVRLGLAGNHAQGCLFRDGMHHLTPALTVAVNRWMAATSGINYGRFDVRAPDYDSIKRGENISVIEMNGLTSEPTAIYDPDSPPWFAWQLLAQVWTVAWAIGAAENRRGLAVPSLAAVYRRIVSEMRRNAADDRCSD